MNAALADDGAPRSSIHNVAAVPPPPPTAIDNSQSDLQYELHHVAATTGAPTDDDDLAHHADGSDLSTTPSSEKGEAQITLKRSGRKLVKLIAKWAWAKLNHSSILTTPRGGVSKIFLLRPHRRP